MINHFSASVLVIHALYVVSANERCRAVTVSPGASDPAPDLGCLAILRFAARRAFVSVNAAVVKMSSSSGSGPADVSVEIVEAAGGFGMTGAAGQGARVETPPSKAGLGSRGRTPPLLNLTVNKAAGGAPASSSTSAAAGGAPAPSPTSPPPPTDKELADAKSIADAYYSAKSIPLDVSGEDLRWEARLTDAKAAAENFTRVIYPRFTLLALSNLDTVRQTFSGEIELEFVQVVEWNADIIAPEMLLSTSALTGLSTLAGVKVSQIFETEAGWTGNDYEPHLGYTKGRGLEGNVHSDETRTVATDVISQAGGSAASTMAKLGQDAIHHIFPILVDNLQEQTTVEAWVRCKKIRPHRDPSEVPEQSEVTEQLEVNDMLVLMKTDSEEEPLKRKRVGDFPDAQDKFRVLVLKIKIKGVFEQSFDLSDFPRDKQTLTVDVSLARECGRVSRKNVSPAMRKSDPLMIEAARMTGYQFCTTTTNRETSIWKGHFGNLSAVRWASSQAHDEWTRPVVKRHSHTFLSDPLASRSYSRYSHVALSFEMERLSWHTVINVILPLFLLSSSLFVVVTQASADTRLQVISALLTAAVAMRFVSASLLPKISYTTELDKYVLGCLISLVVAGIESSVRIFVEAKFASTGSMAQFDQWFFIAHLFAWLTFNIVFALRLLPSWSDLTTRRLRPCEECLSQALDGTAEALARTGHTAEVVSEQEKRDLRDNIVSCCRCCTRSPRGALTKHREIGFNSGRTLCVKHSEETPVLTAKRKCL